MKHEYTICYIAQCCYFLCNSCEEMIALDYPETYEEAEEQYNNLVRLHEHG